MPPTPTATRKRRHAWPFAAIATVIAFGLGIDAAAQNRQGADFRGHWGARYSPGSPPEHNSEQRAQDDVVRRWNEIMLDANALDHTPVAAGENRVFGHNLGPGRTARAFAIVHIAMFDAFNALAGGYRGYTGLQSNVRLKGNELRASIDAAVATAAHDTLVAMYPSHLQGFDERLAEELAAVSAGPGKTAGIDIGQRAAAAILALREGDGSDHSEPTVPDEFLPSDQPGRWRPDPISQVPLALGAYWGAVTPFVLKSVRQFPHADPPALDSQEYADAFNEVKRLGGDGKTTPTERTPDQTIAGIFWGYDGTPGLGTPPRLYNQITREIADGTHTSAFDLARLLALVNVAMADAGIACWDAKYLYQTWRPVTGIREADAGTGPTGLGDNNPQTTGDPNFMPLGAPASNLMGPNFTPPFPAFESGHSAFGSTLFQMLRNFYGTDRIPFTFVSDEFNGVTPDNKGIARPRIPRSFATLSAAEEENGQSRIYLGIHWAFDKTEGRVQGRRLANYVFANAFLPVRK